MTYSTGLALSALSFSSIVPGQAAAVATAITSGRAWLVNNFQGLGNETCTTAGGDPTSAYCGGWTYEGDPGRSDMSNTGFAMTGLKLTGGVPADLAAVNVGWNNNSQGDTTSNPTYSGSNNNGGGSYQPSEVSDLGGDFTSNANDTGSMLFSYADDGLTSADPRVQAAVQFGSDALDTYELQAHSATPGHTMVFNTSPTENGSCDPAAVGCTWGVGTGEGGFHYSMFTLSKALGSYISPDLTDPTNWYTKVADLLVHQQNGDGSWPFDPRDDFTTIFSTGLSVFSLGLVAVPPPPVLQVNAAGASSSCTQTFISWTNPNTPNYGGVWIQRSTTGFPTDPSMGTRVADVTAPGTTFTDTGLTKGTTYYYALFAHDQNGAAFAANGADTSATPVCAAGHFALGYRLQGHDGGVFDYGAAQFYGSLPGVETRGLVGSPIEATANTYDNGGYWLASSSGGVFAYGDAPFLGSLANTRLNGPIMGMAGTSDQNGYWMAGADGGVYAFGDARFYGSLGGLTLNAPIVGITGTPDNGGYWLVASDGGVFAFGDAKFLGSMGGQHLNSPIVGIGASPSGNGYWLAASDGGVFTYGDATFFGSMGGQHLNAPVVAIVPTPTGNGYWEMSSDGGVFAFGSAPFFGSATNIRLNQAITSAST